LNIHSVSNRVPAASIIFAIESFMDELAHSSGQISLKQVTAVCDAGLVINPD
jgi:CO/xanthine dehydrogenase Mo-binding subunit